MRQLLEGPFPEADRDVPALDFEEVEVDEDGLCLIADEAIEIEDFVSAIERNWGTTLFAQALTSVPLFYRLFCLSV